MPTINGKKATTFRIPRGESISQAVKDFTNNHKNDIGQSAELDTVDFDDNRKRQPGHQPNIKDTEDNGYEPVSEAQAVSSGKVHKFITGKNLGFKGKKYSEIDFETIGVDNKNGTIRVKVLAPKEIFGNEMSLDFRSVRRGPFFKTDTGKLNEVKLKDLVGNQYTYVIGNSDEKYLGPNDKKYVLVMVGKALKAYLYDGNFALNYLEREQRKEYDSFFENEILKPMLSKIDFTLNTFFTLNKNKLKWNLSSNDTRKMMDEIFRKNKKIPVDIKREYYEYRLDYAGVKLKESSKADIKEYGQALDLHFILNKDAKLDGTPEPKKAIGEELSLDEKEMVIGIIEILKQVEDPKNRMRIALNMLKKFKEENIEFDYKKFIDHLKEYSMGSYEYDKGNRELGESIIKSMKKVVLDLLPTNTLARHAGDPSRNKEFVEKIVKELGTLLNRFYKQNDIDVVLK